MKGNVTFISPYAWQGEEDPSDWIFPDTSDPANEIPVVERYTFTTMDELYADIWKYYQMYKAQVESGEMAQVQYAIEYDSEYGIPLKVTGNVYDGRSHSYEVGYSST